MSLNFISDENFRKQIRETIEHYGERLQPFDLKKFNANSRGGYCQEVAKYPVDNFS